MKKDQKATTDIILDYIVDLEKSIILLTGEVGEDMYTQLVRSLMALNQYSRSDDITIILNTYGGDLYQALAIYDLIRNSNKKIKIVCNGPVMSAGTIILQSGSVRAMTPKSYLMYHFGRQVAETQQCVAHFEEVTDDIKEIYKTNTKVSWKNINTWFEKEVYYNAQEALKLGLIDEIESNEKR